MRRENIIKMKRENQELIFHGFRDKLLNFDTNIYKMREEEVVEEGDV